MKLVKILIIIVIRKNLLNVEYVLFLYFYVILIFFEKNQKYSIYIYTYQSNEIQSLVLQDYKKFEKVSKENPWNFYQKIIKNSKKEIFPFKVMMKFFSLKVNKKNILMPRSFLLSHSHLFTEIQKINWENFFFHLIQSSK